MSRGAIGRYREGVALVALAWGWEVGAARPVARPGAEQAWTDWDVRLAKMVCPPAMHGAMAVI
jgi:hypothetical protein